MWFKFLQLCTASAYEKHSSMDRSQSCKHNKQLVGLVSGAPKAQDIMDQKSERKRIVFKNSEPEFR